MSPSLFVLPFAFGGSPMEWGMIALIALLLFGGTKLPKLARSLGQSIVEFKRGVRAGDDEELLPEGEKAKELPREGN